MRRMPAHTGIPHQRNFEQVARGLAGTLIVEEPEALDVDRDLICAA